MTKEPMESCTLAIDLGGTNTKIGLLTEKLEIVEETAVQTNAKHGAQAAAELWLKTISPWQKKFDIKLIGIGSPGPLDPEKGALLDTPNLKNWTGFSFTD